MDKFENAIYASSCGLPLTYIFVNVVKTLTSDVSASLFYWVVLKQRLQAPIDCPCALCVWHPFMRLQAFSCRWVRTLHKRRSSSCGRVLAFAFTIIFVKTWPKVQGFSNTDIMRFLTHYVFATKCLPDTKCKPNLAKWLHQTVLSSLALGGAPSDAFVNQLWFHLAGRIKGS